MKHEKGIVFYKDRKDLIVAYGEYLGSTIHRVLTSRIELDVHLNIPLPAFYNYHIIGNSLLIG